MSFTILDSVRDRHIYIPGKTRSGKSTVMYWMAMNDIRQGKGVGIIDPNSDLVTD